MHRNRSGRQRWFAAGRTLPLVFALTILPAMAETSAETATATEATTETATKTEVKAAVKGGADLPAQTETAQTLRERYPDDSIQSTETARQALAEVKQMRAEIDARFEKDRRACFPKFFTNICLNKVKDRQREDLAALRPIEIQANAFNRKQRVVERDKRLAEKAAKDAQERKEQQIQTNSVSGAEKPDSQSDGVESQRTTRAEKSAKKRAAFAEAQRQREENAAADAAKRQQNVQSYENKVEAYEARQREVAKKQAEQELANQKKAP